MELIRYAIYPPAEPGLPWLAVALDDDEPLDVFGCEDRHAAERALFAMKARNDPKDWVLASA